MIANYSAEIKTAIFQSIWKSHRDEDRRQIAGKSRQKLRILTVWTPRLLYGSSSNLDTM